GCGVVGGIGDQYSGAIGGNGQHFANWHRGSKGDRFGGNIQYNKTGGGSNETFHPSVIGKQGVWNTGKVNGRAEDRPSVADDDRYQRTGNSGRRRKRAGGVDGRGIGAGSVDCNAEEIAVNRSVDSNPACRRSAYGLKSSATRRLRGNSRCGQSSDSGIIAENG